jgi:hypothetical protein
MVKTKFLFVPAFLLSFAHWSCRKCELERAYRIQPDWRYTFIGIENSSSWNSYSSTSLKAGLENSIASGLNLPGELVITDTLPDYILRIDSVLTSSGITDQELEDPCQEEHGILYNMIFGTPNTTTFHLRSVTLSITFTLLNAHTHNGKRMHIRVSDSESAMQPPTTDSVNCHPYEVTGTYDPANAVQNAAYFFRTQVRSQVSKWQE